MAYRRRVFFTDKQKSEIWDRWQRGASVSSIGCAFERNSPSFCPLLARTGGIVPLAVIGTGLSRNLDMCGAKLGLSYTIKVNSLNLQTNMHVLSSRHPMPDFCKTLQGCSGRNYVLRIPNNRKAQVTKIFCFCTRTAKDIALPKNYLDRFISCLFISAVYVCWQRTTRAVRQTFKQRQIRYR